MWSRDHFVRSGMSVFVYNGVTIQLLKSEFSVSEERDPSNTDSLWTVYTIKAVGVPTTDGTLTVPSATTLALVEHLLAVPRRPLLYTVNGSTLVNTDTVDAAMGPALVGRAHVSQMTSDAIFVEATYEVKLRDCVGGVAFNPVVSLRWEQSSSRNQLWYDRLTTTGRLIVRSDLRTSADSFRDLATPPVGSNYIRTTADYRLSRSGCELDFTFVDEEQLVMPPGGARKARGTFAVVVSKGSKRLGQVDIHLETGPEGDAVAPIGGRAGLMLLAIKIAFSKLQAEGLGKAGTTLLDAKFSESLMENAVDVSMTAQLPTIQRAVAGGTFGKDGVGVFDSVGMTPYAPPTEGLAPPVATRLGGLIAAAFQDPCAVAAVAAYSKPANKGKMQRLVPNVGPVNGTPVTPSGTGRSTFTIGDLPPGPTVVKDSAPYTHYLIECEYVEDSGTRMLPATGVGSSRSKAAAVTVHGGLTTMEVTWTASRIGVPPVIPSKNPIDPNFVYLGGGVKPDGVEMAADGSSPTYTVSGRYEYGVLDPDKVSFVAPIPPFLSNAVAVAAALATAYTSTEILWNGQGGGQPTDGQTPDGSLALSLAGGSAAGIAAGVIGASQGQGGLDSGTAGGGGFFPLPTVNP